MKLRTAMVSSLMLALALLSAAPAASAHGYGHWQQRWDRERIERIDRYRFERQHGHGWHHGRWQRGWAHGHYGWWWVVGNHWYLYPAPVYPYPYGRPAVIIQVPPVVIGY